MSLTLNSEYIDLLLNRLGRRNDNSLRLTVVDELNMAKGRLERGRFLPWYLLTSTTLTVTVDVNFVALPAAFLREEEDNQPKLIATDLSERLLIKGTYDVLQNKYLNAATGVPKYYAISGTSLFLFPTPVEGYTLNFFYYATQSLVVDNGSAVTNPWLTIGADWILGAAGQQVASFHLQKADMAQRFASAAGKAEDDLRVQHEARQHVNMNYSDDSEYQTA